MPRKDGTGPFGFGPMTGRGAGYCAGFAPYCPGRGSVARGFRNQFYRMGVTGWQRQERYAPFRGRRLDYTGYQESARMAFITKEQEITNLRTHMKSLEDTLKDIRARIEELEDGQETDKI